LAAAIDSDKPISYTAKEDLSAWKEVYKNIYCRDQEKIEGKREDEINRLHIPNDVVKMTPLIQSISFMVEIGNQVTTIVT